VGDWRKIVWGNGMFVAVTDGAVMKSASGKSDWVLKFVESGYGRDIAFGNGYFYIVGTAGIKRSANGEDWETLDLGTEATWRTVTVSDSGDVAVLGGKSVVSHDDGMSWSEYALPVGGWEESVFCGGFFLAIDGISGLVTTEADNIDWTARDIPNFAVRALGAGLDTVIGVGSKVIVARIIDVGAALINANGPNASNPFATMQDVLDAKREAIEAATIYWGGTI
jgi:hypothetical protein